VRSSVVFCASVVVKCFVRAFQCSILCECCSEVLCANVLVIFSLEIREYDRRDPSR
jgi:hypothetical protein